MSQSGHDIGSAIASIESRLRDYENRYQRSAQSVSLLAVSKTKPLSDIVEAIQSGHRRFGENYVDEAITKIRHFRALGASSVQPEAGSANPTADAAAPEIDAQTLSALEWHFIGQIQSRKCRTIAEHFEWAHGVDREKVAKRLSDARESLESQRAPLNVCLQVNVDDEHSKAGVAYASLDALADACSELPGIRLRGLMAIPAPRDDLAAQRAVFATLKQHFDRLRQRHAHMDTLSIGMSGDLEAAVAEGATLVRVGTAIFGARAR